ncbi:MAG: SMP-30/gluconolactonase/LRE family protein [Verrucomicrobiota bacterium]|nr:SMP-30/gluconolactonase/LRE family protein [Verrucomicrobiota bacterium]
MKELPVHTIAFTSLAWLLLVVRTLSADSLESLIAEREAVRLAGGFTFTEGPVTTAEGDVYFNDLPTHRTLKWDYLTGTVEVVRKDTGRANGMRIGLDGRRYVCEVENRRLVAIENGKAPVPMATHYQGKRLNSPNDLWIDPENGIYFTDPRYGTRGKLELDGFHVFYLGAGGHEMIKVCADLVRPNGIIGTNDGKQLYVADEGANTIYRYRIEKPGSLTDKHAFLSLNADGLTLDEKGNLYAASAQVEVYNPLGILLGRIHTDEKPANLTFAGPDKKLLFITAGKSVYGIHMHVSGQ